MANSVSNLTMQRFSTMDGQDPDSKSDAAGPLETGKTEDARTAETEQIRPLMTDSTLQQENTDIKGAMRKIKGATRKIKVLSWIIMAFVAIVFLLIIVIVAILVLVKGECQMSDTASTSAPPAVSTPVTQQPGGSFTLILQGNAAPWVEFEGKPPLQTDAFVCSGSSDGCNEAFRSAGKALVYTHSQPAIYSISAQLSIRCNFTHDIVLRLEKKEMDPAWLIEDRQSCDGHIERTLRVSIETQLKQGNKIILSLLSLQLAIMKVRVSTAERATQISVKLVRSI